VSARKRKAKGRESAEGWNLTARQLARVLRIIAEHHRTFAGIYQDLAVEDRKGGDTELTAQWDREVIRHAGWARTIDQAACRLTLSPSPSLSLPKGGAS
jgi:hypothetical protein